MKVSNTNQLIKSKKIAIICNSSNVDFYKYFRALVTNLNGNDFHFLANKTIVKNMSSSGSNIGVSSYVSNSFLDIFSIIDFSIALFLILNLRMKRVKAIHFLTAHSSNVPQAFFAKLLGIHLVFTIHDLEPHPDNKSMLINLYNKIIINVLADYLIVHSKKSKKKINKANVEFMPLSGFENDFVQRPFNKQLLFFGRIEPYKGVENLYRLGFELLKNKMDYNILIAGKGKLPKTKNGIPGNVKIINRFISDNELKDFHKSSSFTILPYNSASQSGVIIHSYSYGTPVIAYNVGSLSEYIVQNKTGFVVEHNDFSHLINLLKNLDKFRYEQMQNRVLKTFVEKYDSKSFSNYTLEFYNKVL